MSSVLSSTQSTKAPGPVGKVRSRLNRRLMPMNRISSIPTMGLRNMSSTVEQGELVLSATMSGIPAINQGLDVNARSATSISAALRK